MVGDRSPQVALGSSPLSARGFKLQVSPRLPLCQEVMINLTLIPSVDAEDKVIMCGVFWKCALKLLVRDPSRTQVSLSFSHFDHVHQDPKSQQVGCSKPEGQTPASDSRRCCPRHRGSGCRGRGHRCKQE